MLAMHFFAGNFTLRKIISMTSSDNDVLFCCLKAANTGYLNNVDLMLGQRQRRSANIKPTLFQCFVFYIDVITNVIIISLSLFYIPHWECMCVYKCAASENLQHADVCPYMCLKKHIEKIFDDIRFYVKRTYRRLFWSSCHCFSYVNTYIITSWYNTICMIDTTS